MPSAPPSVPVSPPLIFSPHLRALRRDRAAAHFADYDFLYRHMLDGLLDRLQDVKRKFIDVLVIGCPDGAARAALLTLGMRVTCCDPGANNAQRNKGVQANEDRLPFAPDSFDLVLACGTLDTVNDLPGALIVMQRVLRPDGLLLAAFAGAGSLSLLRAILLEAEGDRPGAHIHPQIDVRAAGDLLARTGYAMPVADMEMLKVRYSSLTRLINDIRGMGASNIMTRHSPIIHRSTLARAFAAFDARTDNDGKAAEYFATLYLNGWKPDPSQPKPARRGSATVSLATALERKAS